MPIEAVSNITRAGVGAFTPGGAAAITTANVTIAPAQFMQAVGNVVDANVTPTTSVMPALAPNADWDADDLAEFEVIAQANAGSIDFSIARLGPIVGDFKIIYQLG